MELGENSVAIVTGGASGLGLATVKALASAGCKVSIFDLDVDNGKAIAAELDVNFCQADVTDEDQLARSFATARERYGQEHILICCAGGGGIGKTASRDLRTNEIKRHSLDRFRSSIELNLIGTFACIAHSAAGMIEREVCEGGERGVIILTSSVAAQDGQVGQVAYSAGKAAIVGMTLPIARDLAEEGIRINTILPGIMETPPMLAVRQDIRDGLAKSVPFPSRLGRADEFASMALELVTNSYCNAAVIRLDGGIRMSAQ